MSINHELQDVVDELGRRLSRSVAVDDAQLRLLAYSPHYGAVDNARLGSILHRVADRTTIDHARAHGIDRATGPVRVPHDPVHDMLARICIPVSHQGLRLGFLWLIDAEENLRDDELQLAVDAADAAGAALYRTDLMRELERGRERELLRDLLAPETEARRVAASQLVEESLLVPGPVVALVVRGVDLADETARVALADALAETRRRLPSRRAIHLLRHDHGLVLVSAQGRLAQAAGQLELGAQLRDEVLRRTSSAGPGGRDEEGAGPLVGIGGRQPGLAEAAASYEQAGLAVHVGRYVPTAGVVARWDDLGVYRTLARLPSAQLASEALDPAFARLLEADGDGTFVRTLETFLDLAGSSARTAEVLHVHRTSVYYRLGRIQEITGLDLEDGNSRLALHLSIKIARLAGLDV